MQSKQRVVMYLVYGDPSCHWCRQTQVILDEAGRTFTFVDVNDMEEDAYAAMQREIASDARTDTVPQVFLTDGAGSRAKHLGGYTELVRHLHEMPVPQQFVVYGRTTCPYCQQCQALLGRHQHIFRFIEVGQMPDDELETMWQARTVRSGDPRRTVPQIFLENGNGERGEHIGGFTDLERFLRRASSSGKNAPQK